MGRSIRAFAVVVPVHNEEGYLPTCLRYLKAATEHAHRAYPQVRMTLIFVLDRCTDASEQIVRQAAVEDSNIVLLPVDHGKVGPTRAAGVAHALEMLEQAGIDPARAWLACTDADTRVPQDWLSTLLSYANVGVDAVVGTVEPDRAELGERLFRLWAATYNRGENHGHIHGANLSLRASTYLAAGGFSALPAHEDVDLVERVKRLGFRVRATGAIQVITSGRLTGRAPDGFAAYLANLAENGPAQQADVSGAEKGQSHLS